MEVMYILSILVLFKSFLITLTTIQTNQWDNSLSFLNKIQVFRTIEDDYQKNFSKRSVTPYCLLDEQIFSMKMSCVHPNQYVLVHRTNCKWYMKCVQSESVLMQCPKNTSFNGRYCLSDYKCPIPCQPVILVDNKKNEDSAIESLKDSTFRRWPVDNTSCRNYAEVQVDHTWNIKTIIRSCPVNSWFDPKAKICKVSYLCEDEPNTARKCKGKEAIKQTICDPQFVLPECERGKTAVVAVPRTGCHYYLICDVHQPRLRKCPDGLLFDPNMRNCSADYSCPFPCELYDSVVKEKEIVPPECIQLGNIGPVENSYCSRYFNCSVSINPIIVKCPTNLFFDPLTKICSPGHKCMEYDCVPLDLGG